MIFRKTVQLAASAALLLILTTGCANMSGGLLGKSCGDGCGEVGCDDTSC